MMIRYDVECFNDQKHAQRDMKYFCYCCMKKCCILNIEIVSQSLQY